MRFLILYFLLATNTLFAQQTISPKRLINVSDSYPMESPDGSKIVFQSNRSGNWEIYTMKTDGSELKQLTTNEAADNTLAGRRMEAELFSPRKETVKKTTAKCIS